MPVTVLYAENQYPDDALERQIFGTGVTIERRSVDDLRALAAADCAGVDGLMVQRFGVTREDMARFPNLKCIVRMGVGYDKVDRTAAAVGFEGALVFDASKPDGTPRKLLDVGRIGALGWTYRTSLLDGLRLSYAEFLRTPLAMGVPAR